MADDTLLTIWTIAAPIEDVWEAIAQAERWPSWWKGVEKVEQLEPGDEHGIGRVIRSTWKSKLPYRLAFESRTVKVRKPHTIEIEAIGELEGSGRWELSQADSATEARYYWSVRTTKRWMNLLAPVARPLFRWNHNVVMTQGGEGLARLLKTKLVSAEHSTIPAWPHE